MGLDTLITKCAGQTLTVYPSTAFDQYGNASHSTTASTYNALIVHQVKAIQDIKGVEKVSNTQIYLSGNTTIGIQDKIVLPDGSAPIIIAVQKYPTFTGSTDILTQLFT